MSQPFAVLSSAPVVLDDLPLRIDRDEALRFQGYKKGLGLPDRTVLDIFDEAVSLGERLMAPRAVYRSIPVTAERSDAIEVEGEALHIPRIRELWGPLDAVGAAICTVGERIAERVDRLFEARELPLAVMLDSVGSAAVESLAEFVNDLLCQQALGQGLKVTNRISPGYSGWDTSEQETLFRLCPGDPIGVKLNSSCFMTPVKSISLVVGIGSHARVDHYFTQCRRCWMRDCAFRRVPAATTVRRGA